MHRCHVSRHATANANMVDAICDFTQTPSHCWHRGNRIHKLRCQRRFPASTSPFHENEHRTSVAQLATALPAPGNHYPAQATLRPGASTPVQPDRGQQSVWFLHRKMNAATILTLCCKIANAAYADCSRFDPQSIERRHPGTLVRNHFAPRVVLA